MERNSFSPWAPLHEWGVSETGSTLLIPAPTSVEPSTRMPPTNKRIIDKSYKYCSLLLVLYLDMPLLEQCFVAVGWWVWNNHPVILTFSPETFVQ